MTPVQASSGNMDTHASLLKWVQAVATPGASPVKSTRDLESKCLKKERCALVMKAGPLEVRCVLVSGNELGRRQPSIRVGSWSVCCFFFLARRSSAALT